MKLLEERILRDGEFKGNDIVRVDSFLNCQMDINLISEIGKEFFRLFGDKEITKILTVEASGIGIACITATYFKVPVVFAKKTQSANISEEDGLLTAKVRSFTKKTENIIRVDRRYISPFDRVLLIDDFLATGEALLGMIEIVRQAGAEVAGAGICVEKAFQPGGDTVREMGVDLHSLAIIDKDAAGNMIFIEK